MSLNELYGLTEKQLANRKAVCEEWGHKPIVLNFIGVGITTKCERCGHVIYQSWTTRSTSSSP